MDLFPICSWFIAEILIGPFDTASGRSVRSFHRWFVVAVNQCSRLLPTPARARPSAPCRRRRRHPSLPCLPSSLPSTPAAIVRQSHNWYCRVSLVHSLAAVFNSTEEEKRRRPRAATDEQLGRSGSESVRCLPPPPRSAHQCTVSLSFCLLRLHCGPKLRLIQKIF